MGGGGAQLVEQRGIGGDGNQRQILGMIDQIINVQDAIAFVGAAIAQS